MEGTVVSVVLAQERVGRRRAFALSEALILILVIAITIGGIFSSIAYAMRMRERSQMDLDSYLIAQAWFEALEATGSEKITSATELNAAALAATKSLGGKKSGSDYQIRSFELSPVFKGTANGVHTVELTVRNPYERGDRLRFSRSFNTGSSNTVQDNAYKRRKK